MRKTIKDAIEDCFKKGNRVGAKEVIDTAFKNQDFDQLKDLARFLADSFDDIQKRAEHDNSKFNPFIVACNDGVAVIKSPSNGVITIDALENIVIKLEGNLDELKNPKTVDKILARLQEEALK